MKRPYYKTRTYKALNRIQAVYPQKARIFAGMLLLPALLITGFRFSKLFRYSDTLRHHLVYVFVDTVDANFRADDTANQRRKTQ